MSPPRESRPADNGAALADQPGGLRPMLPVDFPDEVTLDEAAARRLTERIRLLASSLAEQVDKIIGLIDEARAGRADAALGYTSWTAYVGTEFADALPRLDRSQRRDVVAQLKAKGMSSRAIAPVVGASVATVKRDVAGGSAEPPDLAPDDVVDAEIVEIVEDDHPVAPVVPITGRDGKTYTRPVPVPQIANRRAITDAFRDKTTDLIRIVNGLTALAVDDRFGRNKQQIANQNGNAVRRAIDALTGVAEQLDGADGTEVAP